MPKQTFNNLREEKKENIINAALSEFAEYGILNSSVNRIVKSAKIATGSFYQYFEDIEDLYVYVAMLISKDKIQYIKDEYSKYENPNLEETIKALYAGAIKYAVENPIACKMGNDFIKIKNTPLFNKIMQSFPQHSDIYEWIYALITEALKKGEIRKDITPELFNMLMTNINMTIIEYIMLQQKQNEFWTNENLNDFSDLAVGILLNGIKNREE